MGVGQGEKTHINCPDQTDDSAAVENISDTELLPGWHGPPARAPFDANREKLKDFQTVVWSAVAPGESSANSDDKSRY